MFKTCLPLTHGLTPETAAGRQLLVEADVLEYRRQGNYDRLPEKPAVFHWGLGLVQEEFQTRFIQDDLGSFLTRIKAGLFSFDLGPACRFNDYILPLSPTLSPEEIFDQSARSLDLVRNVYDGPLAVENYPYYPTGLYEHICCPDFMAEFLHKFELGLVLDLAHAAVSAANMKLNLRDYLLELPLERVVEIHLSAIHHHPMIAVDAHWLPEEEDFELLTFVLERLPGPGPVLAAVEYYRELSGIRDSYRRLGEILKRLNVRNGSGSVGGFFA